VTMLLAVSLLVTLSCGSAFAAGSNKYTYTVTFLAGGQGTFSGTSGLAVDSKNAGGVNITPFGDKIVVSGLMAGDVVAFNAPASVTMTSEKHYVQGVRLSGHDNDTVADSVFTVNSDEDYVVAYGIKGNMTSYTVHYQDEAGNTLADSDVFYGNVGDKPVVAYKYIEGYEPQVAGFTKTLSENEAENVFTFVYDEIIVEDIIQEVPGGSGSGSGSGGSGSGSGGAGSDDVDDQTPGGDDAEVPDDDEEVPDGDDEEPGDEIVDLDDEETPLGNIDVDGDDAAGSKAAPLVGTIAMLLIALAAIAGVVFFASKRGKK